MSTQAIVLAAGLSSRFDSGNKLLHPYNGKPLIHHAVDTLLATSVEKLIIVTGAPSQCIESNLGSTYTNKRISFVQNLEYSTGMASSIRTGLKMVPLSHDCLICLGDMPLVTQNTIETLIHAAVTDTDSLAFRPVHQCTAGNPVLFKSTCIPSLLSLTGDKGAREFIKNNRDKVTNVPVTDPGIHRDFDLITDFPTAPNS